VRISKAGYEQATRHITVPTAGSKGLNVNLVAIKGIVRFTVEPSDAELLINGKSWGPVKQEMQLAAVEQELEIKQEGYHPFRTKITPRPGFPQEMKVVLKKIGQKKAATPPVIQAANGYTLKLIRPGSFTMGASRREQGRRSNETLRKVTFKRPFYIGVREVTNKEFKALFARHNGGSFKEHTLNRADLPVVEITRDQAAQFCNWLSVKDGLPPVYVKRGDEMSAAEPIGTGYRLPTEAEWEYCARFKKEKGLLKYPWGQQFPPLPKSGNFADASTEDLLANYIEDYNDGYAVTAPPKEYQPNAFGLYDMGGNVAEWCHDYYSIYSYTAGKTYVDPLGPREGKHHVVKGSSWKDASISALRLAYRDYSSTKRHDLGFRICRYATEASK
jgi:formylglycine-generating enzyme required for sulfatase activity